MDDVRTEERIPEVLQKIYDTLMSPDTQDRLLTIEALHWIFNVEIPRARKKRKGRTRRSYWDRTFERKVEDGTTRCVPKSLTSPKSPTSLDDEWLVGLS
jgi:hypothetical protein